MLLSSIDSNASRSPPLNAILLCMYVVGPRVYVNLLDVRKIFGDEWYNCNGLVPDVPGASAMCKSSFDT